MRQLIHLSAYCSLALVSTANAQYLSIPDGPSGEIILDPTTDDFLYDILMGGVPFADPNAVIPGDESNDLKFVFSRYGQNGQAVAMGDFNGDGKMDMVVSSMWAREKHLEGGAVVQSSLGAGKIYIIYGDDTPGLTTPLNPAKRRLGIASDYAGYKRTLHSDFHTGDHPPSSNYPEQTGLNWPTLDTPWYNLFDVNGERRLPGDGGDSSSDRLEGAVLYGQYGYRDVGSTISGSIVTHVVDIIQSRTSLGHVGKYYIPQWNPDGLETFTGGSSLLVTGEPQVGDLTGQAISNAGDVNGDGIDDLLIGAQGYSHPAYEPTAEQLDLPAGSVPLARGNDTGIVYLIFGSTAGIQGALNLDEVGNLIPGVKFIGSGMHMKLGRDVRNGSSLMRDPTTNTGSALDFNNDGLADFVIGSQTVDSGEALVHLNLPGGPVHTVWDPNGDGSSADAHAYSPSQDPLGIDNGIGAAYIIYGEKRSAAKIASNDLNPWNESEYFLPAEFSAENVQATSYSNIDGEIDGACIIGHHQFGYLGYVAFAGNFDGDEYADIAIGAPNHDRDSTGGLGGNQNRGEFYIVFGAGDGNELRGIHEARNLVGAEIGSTDKTRAISLIGELNTRQDYDPSTVFPTGQYSGIELLQGSDMGWAVMAAGDVDGDGLTDVLMGSPDKTTAPSAANLTRATGKACLLYGFVPMPISSAPNGPEDYFYEVEDFLVAATSPSGQIGVADFRGKYNGDSAGEQVFCAGDINADGFADFLISAPSADHDSFDLDNLPKRYTDVGAVYLIYGQPRTGSTPLIGSFSLGDVGSTINGAVFYGDHIAEDRWDSSPGWDTNGGIVPYKPQTDFANAGTWAVGGLDLDGDGIDDLMIGAPNATRINESYTTNENIQIQLPDMGAAFMVYGGSIEQLMDTDCNGIVDIMDFYRYSLVVGGYIGNVGEYCRIADLNRDGVLDCADIQIFRDAFGFCISVTGCGCP